MTQRAIAILALILLAGWAAAQGFWNREGEISTDDSSYAEFAFTRIIFESGYQNLPGPGNTAWRDWPESDMHFIRGINRLTAVDIEDQSRAIRLTSEQLFDRPWIYALEVGTWLLSQEEADNLREYLLRGGFLVVALILDGEDLFPDNWIYVHTPGVMVGRIQNFYNWSAAMVPEQCEPWPLSSDGSPSLFTKS